MYILYIHRCIYIRIYTYDIYLHDIFILIAFGLESTNKKKRLMGTPKQKDGKTPSNGLGTSEKLDLLANIASSGGDVPFTRTHHQHGSVRGGESSHSMLDIGRESFSACSSGQHSGRRRGGHLNEQAYMIFDSLMNNDWEGGGASAGGSACRYRAGHMGMYISL
jgi:hypothetical protein